MREMRSVPTSAVTPGRSLLAWGSILWALLLGGSCALFQSEDSLSPTPTITAPPADTLAESVTTASASPFTDATPDPETTTSAAPSSTTTTSPTRTSLDYLEQLLTLQAEAAQLAAGVQTLNDSWDDRSQTGVSFSDTEVALESAVERAQRLKDTFVLIEAPSELRDEHRIASSTVGLLADGPQEMLDGLRSPDTGQARRAALVGFLNAFDILGEAIARVAEIIGEEATEMLEAARTETPVTTSAETTTSLGPVTTPTSGPAPPDPGNTRNCSDFSTQVEAQEWYDTYFPFYGDVASLDTNDNRVACESLP